MRYSNPRLTFDRQIDRVRNSHCRPQYM